MSHGRYEDDPRWQDAHRRSIEPRRDGESPVERLERGVSATYDKFAIESEYETNVGASA